MRAYRISAGDCIVLEKIGSVVQLTVTLSKRQGVPALCGWRLPARAPVR